MRAIAFASVLLLTIPPITHLAAQPLEIKAAWCRADYQRCPDPPTRGACQINNCRETEINVPLGREAGGYIWATACVDAPASVKVTNVGYGIYDNADWGMSWWQYGVLTGDVIEGAERFCIRGGNESNTRMRALYIRVWFNR
jgi:hypothetical protein